MILRLIIILLNLYVITTTANNLQGNSIVTNNISTKYKAIDPITYLNYVLKIDTIMRYL